MEGEALASSTKQKKYDRSDPGLASSYLSYDLTVSVSLMLEAWFDMRSLCRRRPSERIFSLEVTYLLDAGARWMLVRVDAPSHIHPNIFSSLSPETLPVPVPRSRKKWRNIRREWCLSYVLQLHRR